MGKQTELYKKLMEIQKNLVPLVKGKKNPYYTDQQKKAGSNKEVKYFDINDLTAYVRPMLNDAGLLLLQSVTYNDHGQNGVETQIIDIATGARVTSFIEIKGLTDPQKVPV